MSLKTFLDSEGITKTSVKVVLSSPVKSDDNVYEQTAVKEAAKLVPGEPNYFKMVTSLSFLLRLIITVGLTIVAGIWIVNATTDTDPDTWFNQLYKPDWAPDGIIITSISGFFAFIYAWIWYSVSKHTSGAYGFMLDVLFLATYLMFFFWALYFYKNSKLETARIFSILIVAGFGLLFIISAFVLKIFSTSVLLLFNLAWWIVILFYTLQSKELTKEFAILGLVEADMNNSLYRQKLKLELMNGIKIDASGNKTEFNPDDQE